MKKILFSLFFLISVSAANALPVGIYWGVRGGISTQGSNVSEISDLRIENEESDYFASVNAGVRFLRLRGELEYSYRPESTNIVDKLLGRDDSIDSKSLMANLYYNVIELPFINIYVNGGIGNTKFDGSKDLRTSSNFTWLAGAGVNLSLLNIANVDVGYRYVDMGNIEFSNRKSVSKDVHDIYVGLRFGF